MIILPVWCQAIIWTNAGLSSIGPLGRNFTLFFIGIQKFSLKKMYIKMSSAEWRQFRFYRNGLTFKMSWYKTRSCRPFELCHVISEKSECINSLRPNDATGWHRTGSTLAQVMAWCRQAPSHYLNQCWFTMSEVQWQSTQGNFTRDTSSITKIRLEMTYPILLKPPRI